MLDGIDGSGKSTVIETWKNFLSEQGNAIFDLKKYWQDTGRYPELSEMKSYDFIFSCEPTYVEVGKAIRTELIKNGTNYPPIAIAQAYSLDRLILYNKIIIPALAQEKCVIQDRGVSSSLAYQATQGLPLNEIASLPGNTLALQHRPDHFILTKISPQIIMERIKARTDKQDDAIFERLDFQQKLYEQFNSSEYQKLFTDHGSKIHYLSAEQEIDIMKAEAIKLLRQILII